MINAEYFYTNGYWQHGNENTIIETEKWRILIDSCYNQVTKKDGKNVTMGLITMEVLEAMIAGGKQRRTKAVYYSKKLKNKADVKSK